MSDTNADPNLANAAAQIVMDALREFGVDPAKAIFNEMIRECSQAWARGEMTREEFKRCCENMLIFNPSLALPAYQKMTVTTLRIG